MEARINDMVLRLTEKTTRITHIPKVLYYWRVHDNSVSKDLGTKLYAVDSAIRAIDQQLFFAQAIWEKRPVTCLFRLFTVLRMS